MLYTLVCHSIFTKIYISQLRCNTVTKHIKLVMNSLLFFDIICCSIFLRNISYIYICIYILIFEHSKRCYILILCGFTRDIYRITFCSCAVFHIYWTCCVIIFKARFVGLRFVFVCDRFPNIASSIDSSVLRTQMQMVCSN